MHRFIIENMSFEIAVEMLMFVLMKLCILKHVDALCLTAICWLFCKGFW